MTEIAQTIAGENPADNDSLAGLNEFMQDKFYLHLEKVIPGIVQSYDKTTNRAVIKPAITGIATQGQKVSKDVIENIPVVQFGGGDVTMTFPIKAGMTGWLIAADRDISIFKSIKEETAPNTPRKHKYQDGFFIPDAINNTGTDDFQIKSANSSFNLDNTSISETTQEFNLNASTSITEKTATYTMTATSFSLYGSSSLSIASPSGNISTTNGIISAKTLNATSAFSGTFKDHDNKIVRVVNGIIVSVE